MAHLKVRLDSKDLLKLFNEHPDFEVRLLGNLSNILSQYYINNMTQDVIKQVIENININELTSEIKDKFDKIFKNIVNEEIGTFFRFDKNTNKLILNMSYEQEDSIKDKLKRVLNEYYDNIINNIIKDKLKLIETTDAIDKKVEFFTTSIVSKLIKEKFEKEYTAIKNEINDKYNKRE